MFVQIEEGLFVNPQNVTHVEFMLSGAAVLTFTSGKSFKVENVSAELSEMLS